MAKSSITLRFSLLARIWISRAFWIKFLRSTSSGSDLGQIQTPTIEFLSRPRSSVLAALQRLLDSSSTSLLPLAPFQTSAPRPATSLETQFETCLNVNNLTTSSSWKRLDRHSSGFQKKKTTATWLLNHDAKNIAWELVENRFSKALSRVYERRNLREMDFFGPEVERNLNKNSISSGVGLARRIKFVNWYNRTVNDWRGPTTPHH